jgi:hypothetical protein
VAQLTQSTLPKPDLPLKSNLKNKKQKKKEGSDPLA